jgi:hypothetical protein
MNYNVNYNIEALVFFLKIDQYLSKKAFKQKQNGHFAESLQTLTRIKHHSYFDLRIKYLCEEQLGLIDSAILTIQKMISLHSHIQIEDKESFLRIISKVFHSVKEIQQDKNFKKMITGFKIKKLIKGDNLEENFNLISKLELEQVVQHKKDLKFVGDSTIQSNTTEIQGGVRSLLNFKNVEIYSESHWITSGNLAFHEYGSDEENGVYVACEQDKPCVSVLASGEVLLDLKNFKIEIYEVGIWLGGWGASEYGHFIQSLAPKISMLDDLPIPHEVPLILDSNLPRNLKILSSQLTKRKIIYLEPNQQILVNSLFYITDGNFSPVHLRDRRMESDACPVNSRDLQRLRKKLQQPGIEPTKLIYLTRRSSSWRRVVNENEVERLLEEFNFEVVDLVNLSLIQIKEIFASAKIILSPLSSGLLNIFYSPEKTYVGVIVGQVFNEKYLAGAFAQLGNDIEFIQAKHLNQHRHSDVIVSLGSLRKAVDLILTKEKV